MEVKEVPYVLISISEADAVWIRKHLKGAFSEKEIEYSIEGGESRKEEAFIFKDELSHEDYNILESILVQSLNWR
jgi:hypothetical protein